jgi:hypothetical protein
MNKKIYVALTVILSCLIFWGIGDGVAQQYTLTLIKSGTGSGTVTSSPTGINCGPACSGTFNEGKTVTLKAKADPGSTFKEWGGGCSGTNPACKVTPNADLTITATFALPDLYGEWSDISIQQSKSIYSVSGKLTVYASEGKAVNVKANVYLSDDTIYDSGGTLLGVVSIGTINAGSSKFKNLKYKLTTDPTGKYLIAVIDPGDIVDESNENNNIEDTCLGDSCGVSKVIGPEGGTIEVTDPTSPLYGTRVEIPEGALEQETTIKISLFSKSEVEQQIGDLPETIRFFDGIKIEGGDAALKKAISVFVENSLGATINDQLFVGQVVDLDSKSPSETVYKGVAHVGSPITFNVPNFGSFGVLSPTTPLGLISGTFVDQSNNPVSDGIVAASFSKPFLAQTNNVGYFEIPSGPAGSYAAVTGIPPIPELTTPTGGIGLVGVQLPETLPIPPTSLTDVVVKIVMGQIDLPEPPVPDPCPCDPPPTPPWFTSKEDPEPPFELCPDQTIHTFLFGSGAVYGYFSSNWSNILDLFMYLWSGSLCITTNGRYSTGASAIATVDPITGQLTAHSMGETTINAEMWVSCQKNCPGYVLPCGPYYLLAIPAQVKVGKLVIENESPVGTISIRRPTISANIKSSCSNVDIEKSTIRMVLDGSVVRHTLQGNGSEVQVSYTPNYDLNEGEHTVTVSVFAVNGVSTAEKSWTFVIEEKCVNIAGNWTGRVAESGYRIALNLSQDKCNVTGEFQSPGSCPGQCGMVKGPITGTVIENVFSFAINDDPLVDCDTCEVICYGTDQGNLTVDGNRMHGTVESEDCEIGEFDSVTLSLTRSNAGLSSVETLERRMNIKKSSILRPFKSISP